MIRNLLDGVLDLVFMLESAQLDVLQIREVAIFELVLVSDRPWLDVDEALGEGCLMVDWGLAHALQHRRLFPDAPEPHMRLGNTQMALSYLLAIGGAAYLTLRMLQERIDAQQLHRVGGLRSQPAYAPEQVQQSAGDQAHDAEQHETAVA